MPLHDALDHEDVSLERVALWPMLAGVGASWLTLEMLVPWLRRGSMPRTGLVLIALSLMFVAVMVSGVVVRAIYAKIYKMRRVTTPVVRAACVAALWVPAWVLFVETSSLLMIAAAAICVACLGVFLKQCEVEAAESSVQSAPHIAGTPFFFKEGLLARALLPSLVLVLVLDIVFALVATRWFIASSVAAGVFAGVLGWRAARPSVAGVETRAILSTGRQNILAVAAFMVTLVALLPYLRVSTRGGFANPFSGIETKSPVAAKSAAPSSGYTGVILLPLTEMQKKIIAPPVKRDLEPHFGVKIAEPMEIPFDGQYWYFKWPEKKPRPTARVVRGSSTKTQVSSSDRYPLTMEAHQKLAQPLDLGCCSAMALVVENNDQLSGAISLELWVKKQADAKTAAKARINAVAPEAAPHYLGTVVIPSSELPIAQRPNASGKVQEETLRFPVPSAMDGTLFDEITVVMRTAPERGRMGAKVAVKKFVLEP